MSESGSAMPTASKCFASSSIARGLRMKSFVSTVRAPNRVGSRARESRLREIARDVVEAAPLAEPDRRADQLRNVVHVLQDQEPLTEPRTPELVVRPIARVLALLHVDVEIFELLL